MTEESQPLRDYKTPRSMIPSHKKVCDVLLSNPRKQIELVFNKFDYPEVSML